MQSLNSIDSVSSDHVATPLEPDASAAAGLPTLADNIELTIFTNIDDAEPDWRQLTTAGLGHPYQTIEWCRAYLETIGRSEGIQPIFAVGKVEGKPVVLLPLCVTRNRGVAAISFLGTDFSNQNTGLWDPDIYKAATPEIVQQFLQMICEACDADCVLLRNVPTDWHDRPHPLVLPTAQQSPSPVYRAQLPSDFEEFYNDTHKSRARRNLARKERNLYSAGDFKVVKCTDSAEIENALDHFLKQRDIRAQATGIPNAFAEPDATAFLKKLLSCNQITPTGSNHPLQIWTLEVAGIIRATYICAQGRSTIYVYSNSVAHDDMLPNSPALILAKDIIKYACESPEIDALDMGLGQERYKEAWTSPAPLCDSALSVTLKGRLLIEWQSGKTRIKSSIRNSERLWPLVRRFRQWKAKVG
ncbi:MAG: GNAT family N-acetyltransferase [Roseibium sp.]